MEPLTLNRVDEAGPSGDDGQRDGPAGSGAIRSPESSKDVPKVSSNVTRLTLTEKLPLSLTDPFRYQALDNRPNRFRLLRLLPRRRAWIECELYDSLISKDSRYEALSYYWGDDARVESILLNGKEFRVTDNLYAALRDLTLPDKDRVLWVDGICIDQSNNVEKSQQVQRMSSIFSKAGKVLFWLGKATEEVNILMHLLRQLEFGVIALNRPYSRRDVEDLWFSLQKAYGLQKETKSGLVTLLRRPWFSRVWILQEVAKARRGVICAGRMTVSSSFFALTPSLISVGDENPLYWRTVIALMPGVPKDGSHWARGPDLYDLLLQTPDCQATDPRDRIFALLGMSVEASDRKSIIVDYDKPVHEVYRDLLQYLAHSKKSRLEDVLDIAHWIPGVATIIVLIRQVRSDPELKEERQDRLMREQDTSRYWTGVPFLQYRFDPGQDSDMATIAKTDAHVFTCELHSGSSLPVSEGLYTEVLRIEEAPLSPHPRPVVHHWVHREGRVKLLCLSKHELRTEPWYDSTAFEFAAEQGMLDLLRLLVDLDVVQLPELTLSPCNALTMACERADKAMVVTLLNWGFDPDGPAEYHERDGPLFTALRGRCHDIVKILTEHGANIDRERGLAKPRQGRELTPLEWALVSGQCSVIESMVSKNTASVLFHDEDTPHSIHCIASLKMALDHGLDPSLILAVTLLDFEPDLPLAPICKQAFENGADPNTVFGVPDEGLFKQSRTKYKDVEHSDLSTLSMLQVAILSGCHGDPSTKMEMLLQNGADINQVGSVYNRKTALHLAVRVGCLACIRFLLTHGAHIDKQTYNIVNYGLKGRCNNLLRIKMLLDGYNNKSPLNDGSLTRDAVEAELPLIACESVYHNHRGDRDEPCVALLEGSYQDTWGFWHEAERVYNSDRGTDNIDEFRGETDDKGETDDSHGSDGEKANSEVSDFMLDFVRIANL